MKRVVPPMEPWSHSRSRKRALTEDERKLWESVARQAKPLRRRAQREALPEPEVSNPGAVAKSLAKPVPARSEPRPLPKRPPAAPPLAPLGRRERSQLSRGKKEIDGRLDLHGMTQVTAHHALRQFLHRASAEGMTFVLVITGKGKTTGPDSERGILRRQVPQWLSLPEFRSVVVGFEEARVGHGGEGALYVRVRRQRT